MKDITGREYIYGLAQDKNGAPYLFNMGEVVRCKDCKWHGKEVCSMSYLLDRGGGDEEVRWSCEDDDFCSWGKRKGGDNE